jgi:small subunit ribosomal protein S4
MSRYTGPKARHCRRFGINIYGSDKYDKILAKRDYPPGVHGKGRFRKKSEYGKQLIEKQKTRFAFGITEKQFRRYYEKAERSTEITGQQLLKLLELRADNVVYRAGLARTRPQARQMVNHGLLKLNGQRISTPSIALKVGDKITVRPKTKNSNLFEGIDKQKDESPKWLKVDLSNLSIEIIADPDKDDFEGMIDPQLIVEYYSK